MKAKYHVIIVGAGMAGLAAADVLNGRGLDILVLDENSHTGGQLLRKTDAPVPEPDPVKRTGRQLIRQTRHGIDIRHRVQVLGIFNRRQLLVLQQAETRDPVRDQERDRICEVQADCLILATGARERFLPFPGWTLPGVMSLGAAQILMKHHGILPAREILVGGSSPLQLVLAGEILKNGGRVTAVLDETRLMDKLSFLPLIRDHWRKLVEAAVCSGRMAAGRVPVFPSTRIVEAVGENGLTVVRTVRTDPAGTPVSGSEKTFETRVLAMGYGFTPNIELAVQAGCDAVYTPDMGGWIAATDEYLETSLPGIYAAGETTGIGGGEKSLVEGRLAACAVLRRLGKTPDTPGRKEGNTEERLRNRRQQLLAYAGSLNRLCRLPGQVYGTIPDETLICRCEGITMKTIRQWVSQGFDTPGALKKMTRAGMGACQGRICGPVIQDILGALSPDSRPGMALSRAPVKNVPIQAFLEDKP